MKEQFVTYEIALKLKELGFDEPCLAGWWYDKRNPLLIINYKYSNSQKQIYDDITILALTPLWQQAIDWFRVHYNMHITITSQSQESWQWHIQFSHDSLDTLWEEDFYSYEEALEAGLMKALKLIKTN